MGSTSDEKRCSPVLMSKILAASSIYNLDSTNVVLFDLETTGLDPVKECIIQIAAQSWSDPEKKFNIFIDPVEGIEIPEEASRVNGNYLSLR